MNQAMHITRCANGHIRAKQNLPEEQTLNQSIHFKKCKEAIIFKHLIRSTPIHAG